MTEGRTATPKAYRGLAWLTATDRDADVTWLVRCGNQALTSQGARLFINIYSIDIN